MPEYPLISVLICTYNSSKYVISTLESIYRQNYAGPLELLIGDDCSTDNTADICDKWIEAHKARFVRAEVARYPENVGSSRNHDILSRKAKGEWIKFIAGDDILGDDALTTLYTYAVDGNKTKCFVSSAVRTFSCEAQLASPESCPVMCGDKPLIVDLDYVFRHPLFFLPAPSFFLNRKALESIGYYPLLLRNVEDAPLMYSFLAFGYRLYHTTTPTVFYRVHDKSITRGAGHVFLAGQRDIAIRSILLPCYDLFKQTYLKLFYYPIQYMVKTENKNRVRYKAIKLATKIIRYIYVALFFPLLMCKCKVGGRVTD